MVIDCGIVSRPIFHHFHNFHRHAVHHVVHAIPHDCANVLGGGYFQGGFSDFGPIGGLIGFGGRNTPELNSFTMVAIGLVLAFMVGKYQGGRK
jgi:hypothetical protein